MTEATRLKCGVEVIFNGITSLPNLVKIHRSVQKLLVGDTHTQAGDLISLIPDDGGSTYLLNVGRQLFYTAVHPRTLNFIIAAVRT
jgi:hypothetical protein